MREDLVVELGQAQLAAATPLQNVPVGLRVDHCLDGELLLDLLCAQEWLVVVYAPREEKSAHIIEVLGFFGIEGLGDLALDGHRCWDILEGGLRAAEESRHVGVVA